MIIHFKFNMDASYYAIGLLLAVAFPIRGVESKNCSVTALATNFTLGNKAVACAHQFELWLVQHFDLGERTMPWASWADGEMQPLRRRKRNQDGVAVTRTSFYDYKNWTNICSHWHEAAVCVNRTLECGMETTYKYIKGMENVLKQNSDVPLTTSVWSFNDRVCDDDEVKGEIQSIINDEDLDLSCANGTQRELMGKCEGIIRKEYAMTYYHGIDLTDPSVKRYWDRLAVDTLICVRQVLQTTSCNDVTKRMFLIAARVGLPSIFNVSSLQFQDLPSYNFTSVKRCTVGVYGDPHLKVCFDDHMQTCAAKGHQVYLSHSVFQIEGVNEQVSSVPARGMKKPTNLREVKITFNSLNGTVLLGTYTARNGNLPATFDNGNDFLGTGTDRVVITGDYRRTFTQGGIGMIMALRQWNGNYFFTLRMSENSINQSSGLLAKGCPTNELLNRDRFIGMEVPMRRRRSASEATIEACNNTTTGSQMNEVCQFDVEVTGDIGYAKMAVDAEDDIDVVIVQDDVLRKNAVPPTKDEPSLGSFVDASSPISVLVPIFVSLLFYSFV